jgi:hypothetical protein
VPISISEDFDGTGRPSVPDIGADEFTGTPAYVHPATGFTAVSSSQSQINLGWLKNSFNQDVIVVMNSASITGNPVNGTGYNVGDNIPSGATVIYKGPASAYSHTGLPTWTQYYYNIWSFDAFNYYSEGISTDEVTYANPVTTMPYLMDFDDDWSHEPAAPADWKVVSAGGDASYTWTRYTGDYLSAPACARGYENGPADDYLVSPPLSLPDQGLQLSWYNKVSNAASNNSYKILLSTTNNQVSSFTTELGDFNCTNTDWANQTIDLSDYQGQTVFLAFYHYFSQSEGEYFTIDDVGIELAPPPSTTWTGALSTDWTNPANWTNGVPGSGYIVIIANGIHQAIISTTISIHSIIINDGSSIVIAPAGSLNLIGIED